ncbi:hypothetical protein BBJ28_00010752 [Nothophytophthora sp. Chile5]|nr:hypothetical protein BBJ28_00010752 [Nothophytophthora sp. Chile5]
MAKSNVRAQSEQIFNLQVQGDKYARLLVEQRHRLRQLDDHWKKVHEELKELRVRRGESDQRGGGANAVRARMADEQRELMKLENRLSACKTRESKMVAYNGELRCRVDELRANRVLSQSVFEKNQRRLREIQRQLHETFRQSTQIVAERDRANSLSGQNVGEQEAFDQVYQSLAAIIRREKESAESYRKQVLEQDPLDLSDDFVRGNMKFEDEQQLKKTLQKLDMTLLEDKQSIASINEKLQEFESTFTALQQEMGADDCHELVEMYTKKEEENFALFRYVQSTTNEVEQLEDEKLALEKEIQQILKENTEIERLRVAAAREFQPLARVVDRLYNALGCNDIMPFKNPAEASRASLGANLRPSDPTRSVNAVRAMLPEFLGSAATGGFPMPSTTATTPTPAASAPVAFGSSSANLIGHSDLPTANAVDASIAEDELDSTASDDEDGDRPMTRAELQKRAVKSIASLQAAPKTQPIRSKLAPTKKKKY